jgi:hypothetical protein
MAEGEVTTKEMSEKTTLLLWLFPSRSLVEMQHILVCLPYRYRQALAYSFPLFSL